MENRSIRERLAVPILQGGMGVGVSMGGLAGAVAACGGLGCISTADAGYRDPEFYRDPMGANLRAIRDEIRKAREIAGEAGMIAVNAMVATTQYADAVKEAVKAGVDAVISGAGLPLELPALVNRETAIAPIVSGKRALTLILKHWAKKYDRTADFVVIEGAKAGGHLGFSEEDLKNGTCESLEEILPQVLSEVKLYEERYGHEIPVYVAGGVRSAAEVSEWLKRGAAGIQAATPFIATHECDASDGMKEVLVNAKSSDVRLIHSPVGMPGRALATPLVERINAGERIPPIHCSRCIRTCNPAKVPFCITHALIEAVRGNLAEGLFFTGSEVETITGIRSVREVIDELTGKKEER